MSIKLCDYETAKKSILPKSLVTDRAPVGGEKFVKIVVDPNCSNLAGEILVNKTITSRTQGNFHGDWEIVSLGPVFHDGTDCVRVYLRYAILRPADAEKAAAVKDRADVEHRRVMDQMMSS